MCGITGFVGKNSIRNTMIGIKSLEYRGYDSAGIAFINNKKVEVLKEEGKIENLEKFINYDLDSLISIAHTRWATHGAANKINAHPHSAGKITLVHNGIIENYKELKNKYKDYKYKSETDTEVIAVLMNELYSEYKDMLKTLNKAIEILKGSYALAIINSDYPDTLYAIRKDSPLIVGVKDSDTMLASDVPAILHFTNKYYLLDNYDIVKVDSKGVRFYNDNKEITKRINIYDNSSDITSKNGYDHYMLKEINEEPSVFRNTLKEYINNNKIVNMFDISKYDEIEIVACGSAYHAGCLGKHYIEEYANIKTNVYYASEYRYTKHFYNSNILVIVISQSGETADTLAALKMANDNNVDTLGIVNVYKSSIAREAKHVIYTKAGIEISVATTKAYMAQSLTLLLLALNVKQDSSIIKELFKIPSILTKYINRTYKKIAKVIAKYNHIFYLGREIDYYLALEGSLKLKEISYIHSEAYPAGELKHGTISLMDTNTLVISVVTDDKIKEKTISNLKEVMARDTKVLSITNTSGDFYDYKVDIIENDSLTPFIVMIPMQLIAYEVARIKGYDIDKPRNLAKSVTVE